MNFKMDETENADKSQDTKTGSKTRSTSNELKGIKEETSEQEILDDNSEYQSRDNSSMDETTSLGPKSNSSLKLKREASLNTLIRKKSEVVNHVLDVQTGQTSRFRDIERSIREIDSKREHDSTKLRKVKDDTLLLRFDIDQEQKRVDELEKQNSELREMVTEMKIIVQHMKNQIDTVELHFETQDRELQHMTNKLRLSEEAKVVLQDENVTLVKELQSNNDILSQSIKDQKRINSKLLKAQAENMKLESNLKKFEDKFDFM